MTTSNFIGSYELKERLGRGATGDVYRAVRSDSDEAVAVKVLRGDFSDDPELLARFLQERTVLLRLSSPALVRVRDLVVEGGSAAIIMDLMDSGDLRHRLDQQVRLSYFEASNHLMSIFTALEVVHGAGILHRDVKPENLLFSADGSLHLSDFGVAKILGKPRFTQTLGMLGTPAYMAPEIGLDEEPTTACDIYSAGIVFYEMITGQLPFNAKNPLALMRLHAEVDVLYPANFPTSHRDFLDHVLAKEPSARPSASEAKVQLEELVASSQFTDFTYFTPSGVPATTGDATGTDEPPANGPVPRPRGALRTNPSAVNNFETRVSSSTHPDATVESFTAAEVEPPAPVAPVAPATPSPGNAAKRKRVLALVAAGGVIVVAGVIALLASSGTKATPKPIVAAPIRATVVADGIAVSWPAPSAGSITAYRVSDGATSVTVPTSARRHVFTHLTAGQTYRLRVSLVGSSGVIATRTTSAVYYTTPRAPRVRARVVGSSLVVAWSAPNSDGSPIRNYRVSDGVNSVLVAPSARRTVFRHVTAGRRYRLVVTASNRAGSTRSTPVVVRVAAAPAPTTTLAVTRTSQPAPTRSTSPTRTSSPTTTVRTYAAHPGAPRSITVTNSTRVASVLVYWSPPAPASGYTLVSYALKAFEVVGNVTTVLPAISPRATSQLVTHLNNGAYVFTITANFVKVGTSARVPFSISRTVNLSTNSSGATVVSP